MLQSHHPVVSRCWNFGEIPIMCGRFVVDLPGCRSWAAGAPAQMAKLSGTRSSVEAEAASILSAVANLFGSSQADRTREACEACEDHGVKNSRIKHVRQCRQDFASWGSQKQSKAYYTSYNTSLIFKELKDVHGCATANVCENLATVLVLVQALHKQWTCCTSCCNMVQHDHS